MGDTHDTVQRDPGRQQGRGKTADKKEKQRGDGMSEKTDDKTDNKQTGIDIKAMFEKKFWR